MRAEGMAADAVESPMLDPRLHHYLEDRASRAVRELIDASTIQVWKECEMPGAGGYLLCLSTVIAWHRRFEQAGIPAVQLGRALDTSTWVEAGGYRLRSGAVLDHHFLSVGPELALFDPTAGQSAIAADGPVRIEAYTIHDGTSFLEWRRKQFGGQRHATPLATDNSGG